MPTLPEHPSSPPVFSGIPVTGSSVFCVVFCRSLLVLLYFFFLAIALSVLLRYTDSDYPFGILKHCSKVSNFNVVNALFSGHQFIFVVCTF